METLKPSKYNLFLDFEDLYKVEAPHPPFLKIPEDVLEKYSDFVIYPDITVVGIHRIRLFKKETVKKVQKDYFSIRTSLEESFRGLVYAKEAMSNDLKAIKKEVDTLNISDFTLSHCYDANGRTFFRISKDGIYKDIDSDFRIAVIGGCWSDSVVLSMIFYQDVLNAYLFELKEQLLQYYPNMKMDIKPLYISFIMSWPYAVEDEMRIMSQYNHPSYKPELKEQNKEKVARVMNRVKEVYPELYETAELYFDGKHNEKFWYSDMIGGINWYNGFDMGYKSTQEA